jgi:hypothetical protein
MPGDHDLKSYVAEIYRWARESMSYTIAGCRPAESGTTRGEFSIIPVSFCGKVLISGERSCLRLMTVRSGACYVSAPLAGDRLFQGMHASCLGFIRGCRW